MSKAIACERGMVLMTVLWIVLIVAFVSFSLAAAVRIEVDAAQNSFDSDRALFMAKSAAEVIFQNLQRPGLLDSSPVQEQKGTYSFPFDSGQALVHFESKTGLIDINAAPEELLTSMFDSLGVDEQTRRELVDSILDWRDIDDVPRLYGAEVDDYGQVFLGPNRLPHNDSFQSIDELLLVKHMTPAVYYGRIEFDPAANAHRKIPGLRDIVTIESGNAAVDVNHASLDVLTALPALNRQVAAMIVEERTGKPFENVQDLVNRFPQLQDSAAIHYMTTDVGPATSIVATATVEPSRTSKTVRLELKRTRKKQILVSSPLIYKEIEVIQFGRWQY